VPKKNSPLKPKAISQIVANEKTKELERAKEFEPSPQNSEASQTQAPVKSASNDRKRMKFFLR
jgi:hypothetical protein